MSLTFMTSDSFMKYRYYSRNLTLIAQQIRAFKLNKTLTYTKMRYYFGYQNG